VDDYKNAPTSLSIARAEKEQNACLCPPREILVELLKDIDKGLIVDLCVIAYRVAGDPAPRGCAHYLAAGGVGMHDSLGLLARVQHMINHHGDE
jgi:hypothetical protein